MNNNRNDYFYNTIEIALINSGYTILPTIPDDSSNIKYPYCVLQIETENFDYNDDEGFCNVNIKGICKFNIWIGFVVKKGKNSMQDLLLESNAQIKNIENSILTINSNTFDDGSNKVYVKNWRILSNTRALPIDDTFTKGMIQFDGEINYLSLNY